MSRQESESENESPQFTDYKPNILRMMESMGYDLINGPGLNFSKGRKHYSGLSFQKGRLLTITIKLARVWAMCQLQFRQPLSPKSHYTIITRLAHHSTLRRLDNIPALQPGAYATLQAMLSFRPTRSVNRFSFLRFVCSIQILRWRILWCHSDPSPPTTLHASIDF